jgi:uncharacterized protein YutE (UPF0331/DUF86 family)
MTSDEILGRAQIVRANLEYLARIPQGSWSEFESDFRNVEATLHLLQTSIQSLIDIGSTLCARLGLETPRSNHEILERLEADGRLPRGSADRFAPILGFRNRVVHLYDRIDQRIVYRILTENRGDLRDLLDLLLSIDVE